MTAIEAPGLLTFTIAIVVFFAGAGLNRLIPPLRRWNIPEAVTGGLLAAVLTLIAYVGLKIEIGFALEARDLLLLYFFTGIGLNARLDDLISGGRPFLVLLGLGAFDSTRPGASFWAVFGGFFVGLAYGLPQIRPELGTVRAERFNGLSPCAYVLAKTAVLVAPLAVADAVILLAPGLSGRLDDGGPRARVASRDVVRDRASLQSRGRAGCGRSAARAASADGPCRRSGRAAP